MGFEFRNVRPYQGRTISSATGYQAIAPGVTYTFLDIAGMGALRTVAIMVNSGLDSQKMLPWIEVDGVVVQPECQFKTYDDRGYDGTSLPFKLTLYNVDGINHGIFLFNPELIFDSSLKVKVKNWSVGTTNNVMASWIYCLIP